MKTYRVIKTINDKNNNYIEIIVDDTKKKLSLGLRISGPINIRKLDKDNKRNIFFGDRHESDEGLCNTHDGESIFLFFEKILQKNPEKQIQIFLEGNMLESPKNKFTPLYQTKTYFFEEGSICVLPNKSSLSIPSFLTSFFKNYTLNLHDLKIAFEEKDNLIFTRPCRMSNFNTMLFRILNSRHLRIQDKVFEYEIQDITNMKAFSVYDLTPNFKLENLSLKLKSGNLDMTKFSENPILNLYKEILIENVKVEKIGNEYILKFKFPFNFFSESVKIDELFISYMQNVLMYDSENKTKYIFTIDTEKTNLNKSLKDKNENTFLKLYLKGVYLLHDRDDNDKINYDEHKFLKQYKITDLDKYNAKTPWYVQTACQFLDSKVNNNSKLSVFCFKMFSKILFNESEIKLVDIRNLIEYVYFPDESKFKIRKNDIQRYLINDEKIKTDYEVFFKTLELIKKLQEYFDTEKSKTEFDKKLLSFLKLQVKNCFALYGINENLVESYFKSMIENRKEWINEEVFAKKTSSIVSDTDTYIKKNIKILRFVFEIVLSSMLELYCLKDVRKTWNITLDDWEKGFYPTFKNVKKKFIWRTNSYIKSNTHKIFEEEIIYDDTLPEKQDFTSFLSNEAFSTSTDKDVVSFYNKSGDTMMVVPGKQETYNFATLYHFMKNADEEQKKKFWTEVKKQIILMSQNGEEVWVSTHGKGVSYLHVRISKTRKYYGNEESLEKIQKYNMFYLEYDHIKNIINFMQGTESGNIDIVKKRNIRCITKYYDDNEESSGSKKKILSDLFSSRKEIDEGNILLY